MSTFGSDLRIFAPQLNHVVVRFAMHLRGARYAWGSNERGQLGIGSTEEIITWIPTVVSGLDKEGVFSIHAGPSSSAAMASNGRVFFWGSNKCNKCAPVGDLTPPACFLGDRFVADLGNRL